MLPNKQKQTILLLSDDIRSNSGIATVSREIVLGCVDSFNFVQIAGSLRTPDAGKVFDLSQNIREITNVDDAFVRLHCVNGYGDKFLLTQILDMYDGTHDGLPKIDIILHFTDPRFWDWLYRMEYEIRRNIPIAYLNIWDDDPAPHYNHDAYASCDLLMCINKQTYGFDKEILEHDNYQDWQITYVPHGINSNIYKPVEISSDDFQLSYPMLADLNKFVVFYNARNITRKHIPTIIEGFELFVKELPEDKRNDVLLLLHTAVVDANGTNLSVVIDRICKYSKNAIAFTNTPNISMQQLNLLNNRADVGINISDNEGFGLGVCECLMSGTPIIVNVTGGLQDQCGFQKDDGTYITEHDYNKDMPTNANKIYTKHGDWVYPLFPKQRILQGSPQTPYIYADYVDANQVSEALTYWYNIPRNKRKECGLHGREWLMNPKTGMDSVEMCNRIKHNITTCLDKFVPRPRVEFVKTK